MQIFPTVSCGGGDFFPVYSRGGGGGGGALFFSPINFAESAPPPPPAINNERSLIEVKSDSHMISRGQKVPSICIINLLLIVMNMFEGVL